MSKHSSFRIQVFSGQHVEARFMFALCTFMVTLFCSSCLYTVQNIMNVQTLISYTAQHVV